MEALLPDDMPMLSDDIPTEEMPMTMEEIRDWNPELEPKLTKINKSHKMYINWIHEIDESRDENKLSNYAVINGDNVINIYKSKNMIMKRMRCNLCNEYQYIADSSEPPRCAMAIKFGGIQFDQDIMDDHFENMAHKKVIQYIIMMQYKDKLLQHEFGGSDHITTRLKDIIAKMFDEQKKAINKSFKDVFHQRDSFSHLPKPPLYPFNPSSVKKVKKRLGDALAFSINQSKFIEDIIHQAIHAASHHIENEKKENVFNIVENVNNIPAVLSDLEKVNNALQVISIARPIIMKRLFQALIRESTLNVNKKGEEHKYDNENVGDIFESALKIIKSTIVNDIVKLNKLHIQQDDDDDDDKKENNILLFENGMNNIHIDNWKYRDIDLSLLFDIYSIYRIYQYVNKGKFDTSIADFRERCGGYQGMFKEKPKVDNDITMDEATVFQNAIRYFIDNIVQPIKLNKSCVINGDVQQYMIYIFAMSTCLKQLFEKQKNQEQKSDIGDIQFDMVLIAKSSINIFTGKELHNQVISGLDIKTNLETVGIKTFVKHEISDEDSTDRKKITDKISIMFKSLALKLGFDYDNINEKLNNKRFVLLIDKRRINNNNDILYLYESMEYIEKIENNNSIGLDNDGVMHWLCEKYLIPKSDGTWIGSMKSMDGYLFTYSFHIHGYNTYRCYLYFNGGCTRTFPEHFVELIPKYFMYPIHDQKFKKDFKKEFIKILYSHDYKHGFDLILTDNIFTEYYRIITGLYHITVNYRRVEPEEKKKRISNYNKYC
eukprot:64054_1